MICFIIGCTAPFNTEEGGHYRSLQAVSSHLTRPFRIVVLGNMMPVVLRGANNVELMTLAGFREAASAGRFDDITLFHAYDHEAALAASGIARRRRVPLVQTKPGQAMRGRMAPRLRNTVFFQEAEFAAEKRLAWFGHNYALIPQRVNPPDHRHAAGPIFAPDTGRLRILVIARIVPFKEVLLRQSLHLSNLLARSGVENDLRIIGIIQDPALFADLSRRLRPHQTILTDSAHTDHAPRYVPQADVIVGVGRSFVEGMAAGKLLFFPATGRFPNFLTAESYPVALAHNFSDRAPGDRLAAPRASLRQFLAILRDPERRAAHERLVIDLFERDHAASTGARLLERYYAACRPQSAGAYGTYRLRCLVYDTVRRIVKPSRRSGAPLPPQVPEPL